MKFKDEWLGDGVCDNDRCGGCPNWTSHGYFDGGDCLVATSAETSVGTFAVQQETSYVVYGFALLGLGAVLYGAGSHYFKKQQAAYVEV